MSVTAWLGRTDNLQVGVRTLAPAEGAPWHFHTSVTDTVVGLSGIVAVHLRAPDETVSLAPGEMVAIAPMRPHRVVNPTDAEARFLLVQGVGPYDFNRID